MCVCMYVCLLVLSCIHTQVHVCRSASLSYIDLMPKLVHAVLFLFVVHTPIALKTPLHAMPRAPADTKSLYMHTNISVCTRCSCFHTTFEIRVHIHGIHTCKFLTCVCAYVCAASRTTHCVPFYGHVTAVLSCSRHSTVIRTLARRCACPLLTVYTCMRHIVHMCVYTHMVCNGIYKVTAGTCGQAHRAHMRACKST
jgi:hypothetical protein